MPRRPKAKFKVRDRDMGMKALMARARQMGNLTCRVGVLEGKGEVEREGLTLAELASIHEFGSPEAGIPERSFLRATVDENAQKYADLLRRLADSYVKVEDGTEPMAPRRVLATVGAVVVGDVQKRISAGIPPPNAPATIKRKGSSTPLVDTGQLRQSITYAVEVKKRRAG